jgi:hypothetical protein
MQRSPTPVTMSIAVAMSRARTRCGFARDAFAPREPKGERMAKWGAYLERTFGYRRLYVDAVIARAPHRGVLAVASEVARLAFAVAGCALVALVFWLLAAGAAARSGAGAWFVISGACAVLATLFAVLAASGIWRALRDLQRVRREAGRP